MIPFIPTQKDIELDTLKNYLQNEGLEFNDLLIDNQISEPVDIRYNSINYQVTIGDKEKIEEMRRVTSKGERYIKIRSVSNIAELLLRGALTKKSTRSDSNTILLIEVSSTGGLNWKDLENEVSRWASANYLLCKGWKIIFLVFNNKNIKLKIK